MLPRSLVRALLFGAGLALGSQLLGHVPEPLDPDHAAIARVRRECEVLFVGPSYVKSQVRPEVVDREAARLGRPVRSCKFAKTHLKGFEQFRELRSLLSEPWPKLKLVLIDVTLGADSGYRQDNRFKPRIIRFHTWELFDWYLQFWDGQGLRGGSHLGRWVDHGLHFAANVLGVGRGAEYLASWQAASRSTMGSGDGDAAEQVEMSARENQRKVKRLRKKIKAEESGTSGEVAEKLVTSEIGLVRKHGYRGEALVAPTWSPGILYKGGPSEGGDIVVHNFADPGAYPSLYSRGRHKQDGHLTSSGAEEYSRLLGKLVVTRMAQ